MGQNFEPNFRFLPVLTSSLFKVYNKDAVQKLQPLIYFKGKNHSYSTVIFQ